MLNGGTLTLNGAIGGLTTQVGSAARQADYSAQAQQVIHDQAQASRDAISGVNLDEEAADLMRCSRPTRPRRDHRHRRHPVPIALGCDPPMNYRISTNMMYQQSISTMLAKQAKLAHTQQQLASGQRLVTAKDDPVAAGTADLYHGVPAFWISKSPGIGFFGSFPFGMTVHERQAWMMHGGGQALYDEVYGRFGVKPFNTGDSGPQWMGWFRREIRSVDDFRGLRFRTAGLGGEMFRRAGASVVTLPAGEIFAAMQSGTIDAAEFIGPLNDLALGFHQVAKISYGPGVQEPGGMMQLMVNRRKWDGLPKDIQAIIRVASQWMHEDMKVDYDLGSGRTMEVLRTQHGVRFLRFNNDVLTGLGTAAGEMVQEMMDTGDDHMKRTLRSYLAPARTPRASSGSTSRRSSTPAR